MFWKRNKLKEDVEKIDLSKRRTLGLLGSGFIAGVGATLGLEKIIPIIDQHKLIVGDVISGKTEELINKGELFINELKDPNKIFERLNLLTSGAVFAGFSKSVLYEGLIKGKNLGIGSTSQQISLAGARIALLKLFGGEEGLELGEEELHELTSPDAIIPIAVLIALSDISEDISVDANQFIETNGLNVDNLDYSQIDRPDLNDELIVWQEYLNRINDDLKTQTKNIASIASILGLVGTTYTSSSVSNKLKVGLSRIVYEQSFAKALIEKRALNQECTQERIDGLAITRTNELINGAGGFSKLAIALYANGAGNGIVGNPPEIYFLMEFAKNPEIMAINESLGLSFGEISNIAMNAWWLKKAGVSFGAGDIKDLISGQIKVISGLIESFKDKDLRNASFGDGQNGFKNLLKSLKNGSEIEKKMYEALKNTKHTKLHFSPVEYLSGKLDHLKDILSRNSKNTEFVNSMLEMVQIYEGDKIFEDTNIFNELFEGIGQGKVNQVKKIIIGIEEKVQGNEANKLSLLFENFIKSYEEKYLNIKVNIEDVESEEGYDGKLENIIQTIKSLLDPSKDLTDKDRIERAMKILQNGNEGMKESLIEILSSNGLDTLKDGFNRFTTPEETEGIATESVEVSDIESDSIMGEEIGEATKKLHPDIEKHLLSHTAQEVMFALLTQVPSVPAMKALAQITIYEMIGKVEGEALTSEQLKKAIPIVAIMTACISAVADNVAAYLFGRGVLESFFKETYGEDILEKNKELQIAIVVLEKMIAEMAGSLTKVGNGPNFAQKKIEIFKDINDKQGINLDLIDMPMGDTLKNHFAQSFTALTLGGSISYLLKLAGDIEKNK